MVFNAPTRGRLEWLFLDLNSYFASVEQQDNPALRGKPVAVVPMMTDSTCAIAASYEAKRYGIKTGTNIGEARQRCPELICVLAQHDAYVKYHHKILSEVVQHTPIHTVWSIDELSSRLSPDKHSKKEATKIAYKIKRGFAQNIGTCITCSIGIAPNSFLAKVATDMQKPDGLVILAPEDLPGRLFDLKLTDLPGISDAMEFRLWRSGIKTIEDLWHTSPKQARAIWGNVGGERFWYNLHGYDVPVPPTQRGMIGHSRVLDPAHRAPAIAHLVARRLTIKAASRLRRENFYAASFDMSVRCVNGQRFAARSKMSPAKDSFVFLKALDDMWAEMLSALKPHRLKKISVVMHSLCRETEITPDLFEHSSAQHQHTLKRHEALSNVLDRINAKYGAETLRLGIIPKTQAGFLGTKIAFSRIPDAAEFNE